MSQKGEKYARSIERRLEEVERRMDTVARRQIASDGYLESLQDVARQYDAILTDNNTRFRREVAAARIEGGEQLPPDDIAYSMVMLYDSQYLAVQHLRRASQLAASILPPVEQITLQTATIRLYNSFARWADKRRDRQLMEIAEDGLIDDDERPIFEEIVRELGDLVKDFYELRLAAAERE